MAKRRTGIGKHKKSHSHKTKKRLAAKRLMLEAKASRHTKNFGAAASKRKNR